MTNGHFCSPLKILFLLADKYLPIHLRPVFMIAVNDHETRFAHHGS